MADQTGSPGWYPDPSGSGQQRYFDGIEWTDNVVPAAAPGFVPPAPKRRGALYAVLGAVAVVALIGIGIAIGSSTKKSVVTTPVASIPLETSPRTGGTLTPAPATSPPTTKPTTPPTTVVAHVGSTLDVPGSDGTARVTLDQVIDPAPGADEFNTPNAGMRFVGVKVTIANAAGTVSDDANNDLSVQGSDQQSYTSDIDSIAGCTNFNSGEFTLAPGDSVIGCVVFQLPNGVTTKRVQFNLGSGFGGTTGEWRVP